MPELRSKCIRTFSERFSESISRNITYKYVHVWSGRIQGIRNVRVNSSLRWGAACWRLAPVCRASVALLSQSTFVCRVTIGRISGVDVNFVLIG
jgi:hypothetical protein